MTQQKYECYCITHLEPLVPKRLYTECIAMGDYQPEARLHISNIDQFWHENRPFSFAAAGMFSVHKVFGMPNPQKIIGLSYYRKILLRKQYGKSAPVSTFLTEVLEENKRQIRFEDTLPREGHDFFVTAPINLGMSVLQQYEIFHNVWDLLDYVSLAVDLKIIAPTQVSQLLQSDLLIPGGGLFGYFPSDWLFSTLNKLERLAKAFLTQYKNRIATYDHYQVRALEFLTERLSSYMLMQELFQRYDGVIPAEVFGYMHVFVENEGGYLPGVSHGVYGQS